MLSQNNQPMCRSRPSSNLTTTCRGTPKSLPNLSSPGFHNPCPGWSSHHRQEDSIATGTYCHARHSLRGLGIYMDLLPLLLLHLDWVPQPQRATRGIFRAEPNTAAVSVALCQLATWRGKVLKHWPNSRGDEFPEAGVQKY